MKRLISVLLGRRAFRLFLLLGLLLAGHGLWQGGKTAVFVHEAVCLPARVTDVRQHPFSGMLEALRGGDFRAETAYTPIVQFTLPNGMSFTRPMPDSDAEDYCIGAATEVISMPLDPTSARLNKGKFLWGEAAFCFGGGLLLLGLSRLLRGRKCHPARRQEPRRPQRTEAPAEKPRRESPAPKRSKKGQMELDLGLAAESGEKKRRSPRRSGTAKKKRKEA